MHLETGSGSKYIAYQALSESLAAPATEVKQHYASIDVGLLTLKPERGEAILSIQIRGGTDRATAKIGPQKRTQVVNDD